MANSDPSIDPAVASVPRTVPADRAFAWYAEALRLFKRHPLRFAALAVVIVAVELLLDLVPVLGRPAGNVLVPLVACGLLYAHRRRPRRSTAARDLVASSQRRWQASRTSPRLSVFARVGGRCVERRRGACRPRTSNR